MDRPIQRLGRLWTIMSIVLILDGKSEMVAVVRSNRQLNCLRHLIRSKLVTNRIFPRKKTYFLHTCATCSEIPFNMCTMIMSFMLQCNHACKFARVPKKLFADCEINNVYVAEGLQGGTKKYAFFFYGWSASLAMHDVPIF